ncbi:glutamine synthetase [candidate division KSB1 bacterium]|nr:glutamine synthetase [candidate division KSB1 bacterium]
MAKENISGMLEIATLKHEVENGNIDTILTVFPDMYGRLVGKRITSHFFLDHVSGQGMHACDYLLACDMEMDPVPGYKFSSWETGYGDFSVVPDMATLRRASWLPKAAMVMCDLYSADGEKVVEIAPRRILQKQIDRARSMGFEPMAGSELEFFIFKETLDSAKEKNYLKLQTFGWYIEDYHILQGTKEEDLVGRIRNCMDESGVPVEFSKGEWGPGQHEINLKYSDFMEMADRHSIYKHAAKEIAFQKELSITFMAKWDEKLAGSSMHLHVSLWDELKKENQFKGTHKIGPVKGSDVFRWFLGGWMYHAQEIAIFYAPNVNSYKRYQAGSFAPTKIAWSYDNRTAGFRIVGKENTLRIECRIPGADANPYLAFAATLAAGLDGIDNKIEPPDVFTGNVYLAKDLPEVPNNLRDAIKILEKSKFAHKAFGNEVVDHYLHFFSIEQSKFDQVVTNWERERFFERI